MQDNRILEFWYLLTILIFLWFSNCGVVDASDTVKEIQKQKSTYKKAPDDTLKSLESIASQINKKAVEEELTKQRVLKDLTHSHLGVEESNSSFENYLVTMDENSEFHFSWKLMISFGIILFASVF